MPFELDSSCSCRHLSFACFTAVSLSVGNSMPLTESLPLILLGNSRKVKYFSLDNLKPALLGKAPGKTNTVVNRKTAWCSTNVVGNAATRASDPSSLPDHNGLGSVSRSRSGEPM